MNEFATRRRLLALGLAFPLVAFWRTVEAAQPVSACSERKATRPEIAGPYFKPGSPERQSLVEPGMKGRRLILTGSVTTKSCEPIPGALLDFWQANADGQYDNTGFRLRGHQSTNAEGHYKLETIVPGVYPGRTEHIHVKLKVAGRSTLTTQLYFPGEQLNGRDPFFHTELLVSVVRDADPLLAKFDFVVSV